MMREDHESLKGVNSGMSTADPISSDRERAASIKHDLALALAGVAEVMDRARSFGLTAGWQGVAVMPSGKHEATGITVARYF